jgi:hypothetical protein
LSPQVVLEYNNIRFQVTVRLGTEPPLTNLRT